MKYIQLTLGVQLKLGIHLQLNSLKSTHSCDKQIRQNFQG